MLLLELVKRSRMIVFTNIISSLLYGCLSLFIGILVAWVLEVLLHKGSNVEFELPQGTESSIQQNVHGDSKKGMSILYQSFMNIS